MFDIGFTELLVIAIVGIVVIGPERLPEAIRTLALWISRFRRMASRLYREVEKEVGMDDIRRQLHNEEILRDLEKNKRQQSSSSEATDSAEQPDSKSERDGER